MDESEKNEPKPGDCHACDGCNNQIIQRRPFVVGSAPEEVTSRKKIKPGQMRYGQPGEVCSQHRYRCISSTRALLASEILTAFRARGFAEIAMPDLSCAAI